MKTLSFPILVCATVACVAVYSAATAQAATFSGAIDNTYLNAGNWSPSGIPDTANGATAQIANGSAVTYNPGADLIVGNGGTLQITNGSWTQTGGGNWIQVGAVAGNGHILVDGGTFNQGTAGAININGTGNTFSITSGAANINYPAAAGPGMTWNFNGGATTLTTYAGGYTVGSGGHVNIGGGTTSMTALLIVSSGGSFSVSAGTLTLGGNLELQNGSSWSQTGGTVNLLGANSEFQFSSTSGNSMSGGILNVTRLLTGVNGPVGSTFNFSGGTINVGATYSSGFYGANDANHPFNFTLGSTGIMKFDDTHTTISQVNAWLAAGGIQYNNTIDPSAFNVTDSGGYVTLVGAVPEPATWALLAFSLTTVMVLRRRRRA